MERQKIIEKREEYFFIRSKKIITCITYYCIEFSAKNRT